MARHVRAVYRGRCQSDRAAGWNARLVACQDRQFTKRSRSIRSALEEDRREQLADPKTSRLSADRLRIGAGAMGIGNQPAVETRPAFLFGSNADRAGR